MEWRKTLGRSCVRRDWHKVFLFIYPFLLQFYVMNIFVRE